MKKFRFTLESVYNYKKTVEKTQKAELAAARAALRRLEEEDASLAEKQAGNAESARRAFKNAKNIAEELRVHDRYAKFLTERREALKVKLLKAAAECERLQQILIVTMKELKAYEKLRSEQYAVYLEELRSEEAKEMDDIISFKTISGGMQ